MSDGTWITIISLAVTFLFMMGTPVLLVIFYWVVGCSFVLDLTLDNTGAEMLNVFKDGFALLAMPLFILTGDLINRSGIAKRLSDYAYACLGWLRGGLAMASIGACGLFAAISGSNSATTATIGSMLHPEMVKGGYDERFSAATAAAGGTVGIIIPPSIIFIVYGFLMNLEVGQLFLAGIIPGVLMVLAMMLVCFVVCTINKWGILTNISIARIVKTAIGAWLGFFAIGLVLWGIYTGKFSPTEAAGVTVGFGIIVGLISFPLNKIIGSGKDVPIDEKSVSSMFVVEGFKFSGDSFDCGPFRSNLGDSCAADRGLSGDAADPLASWRSRDNRWIGHQYGRLLSGALHRNGDGLRCWHDPRKSSRDDHHGTNSGTNRCVSGRRSDTLRRHLPCRCFDWLHHAALRA